MFKRNFVSALVIVTTFILGGILQPFQYLGVSAQAGCQTFKETGFSACGRFLEYWRDHGGLAQQGFPLSGEFTEVSDLNGKSYTVQYFERAVFEKHPENSVPNDVLLSQLGTFQLQRKYPSGPPVSNATSQPVPPVQATPTTVVSSAPQDAAGFAAYLMQRYGSVGTCQLKLDHPYASDDGWHYAALYMDSNTFLCMNRVTKADGQIWINQVAADAKATWGNQEYYIGLKYSSYSYDPCFTCDDDPCYSVGDTLVSGKGWPVTFTYMWARHSEGLSDKAEVCSYLK